MDSLDNQLSKERMMVSLEEKLLAHAIWRTQKEAEEAENAIDAFYRPLIMACKTKYDAEQILIRIPDCVSKVFLTDYVYYGRKW